MISDPTRDIAIAIPDDSDENDFDTDDENDFDTDDEEVNGDSGLGNYIYFFVFGTVVNIYR